jgi:4-amino-4-deoxy-L-arabinose transferase-like glycosyltransferase
MNESPVLSLRHYVAVAMILLLAACLRIHDIGHSALSVDELESMSIAAGHGRANLTLPRGVLLSPPPIVASLSAAASILNIPNMASDVHPPLYFILLRIWQSLLGDGDASSRSLSATAGVISVLLIIDVGRWMANIRVGLWAGLIMALAQPEVEYSQNARPYAMMVLMTLAAADAMARIERMGWSRPRIIALILFLTAACLTHYFVLPAIAATGLYAALRLRGKTRIRVLCAFAAAGAMVLVLWGRGVWIQRANFSDSSLYWFKDSASDHFVATLGRLAVLPIRYLAEPMTSSTAAAKFSAILYVLPWLLCRRKPWLILPGLWLIGSVGLVAGLDLCRGTLQLVWIKYTLLAGVAIYLILPALLDGWAAHALAAAAAITCLLALPQISQSGNGDFKELAADLDRLSRTPEPVVFVGANWGPMYTGGLFLGTQRYWRRPPASVVLLDSPATAALQAEMRERAPHCWLVMTSTNQSPETYLPGWRATQVNIYPNVAMLYEMTSHAK